MFATEQAEAFAGQTAAAAELGGRIMQRLFKEPTAACSPDQSLSRAVSPCSSTQLSISSQELMDDDDDDEARCRSLLPHHGSPGEMMC